MRRSVHLLFGAAADGAQAPGAPTRTGRGRSSRKWSLTLGGARARVRYASVSRKSCFASDDGRSIRRPAEFRGHESHPPESGLYLDAAPRVTAKP
jgi:hypothetical protein